MILLQIFTHIRCVRNKSVLREECVDLFAGRHGRGRADALHGQGSQAACEAGSLPDVLALGQSGQQAAIEGIACAGRVNGLDMEGGDDLGAVAGVDVNAAAAERDEQRRPLRRGSRSRDP